MEQPLHARIEALNMHLQSIDPAELESHYKALETQLNALTEDTPLTERIFLQLSNVMYLITMRQLEGAIEQLHAAKDRLDSGLAEAADDSELKSLLVEWNYLAMKLEISRADTFVELDYYRNIIDITADETGYLALHHWRGKLGMANNFRFWQQQGGDAGTLEATDSAYISATETNLKENVQAEIRAMRQREDVEYANALQRTLARYLLAIGQVEGALQELQRLAEVMEADESVERTELADLLLELGELQLQHGQLDSAKAHLQQAKLLFEEAGEVYEILAAQAEGLMEMAEV